MKKAPQFWFKEKIYVDIKNCLPQELDKVIQSFLNVEPLRRVILSW